MEPSMVLTIPTELLEEITSYLPAEDFGSFRLTRKKIEHQTLKRFRTAYFRHVKFMYSKYAFKALGELSQSRMGQYVKILSLGPPSGHGRALKLLQNKTLDYKRKVKIVADMEIYSQENENMCLSGGDEQMLDIALNNLQNLTEIRLLPEQCYCYPTEQHVSYGMRYLLNEVGGDWARFEPQGSFNSLSMARLFYITLCAVEFAQLRLKSFEAQAPLKLAGVKKDPTCTHGFPYEHPLEFPVFSPTANTSHIAFTHLTRLMLPIIYSNNMGDSIRRQQFVNQIASFLTRTPSLITLGITFSEHVCESDLFAEELVATGSLSKIPKLELTNMSSNNVELSQILGPLHTSLRSLKLLNLVMLSTRFWLDAMIWIRNSMDHLQELEIQTLWFADDDNDDDDDEGDEDEQSGLMVTVFFDGDNNLMEVMDDVIVKQYESGRIDASVYQIWLEACQDSKEP